MSYFSCDPSGRVTEYYLWMRGEFPKSKRAKRTLVSRGAGKMIPRTSRRIWLTVIVNTIATLLLALLGLFGSTLAGIISSLPLWFILVSRVALAGLAAASTLWYERLKSPPTMPMAEAFSPKARRRMLGLVPGKMDHGISQGGALL